MIALANDPAASMMPTGALFGRGRKRPPEDPNSIGVQLRERKAIASMDNAGVPDDAPIRQTMFADQGPTLGDTRAMLANAARNLPGPISGYGGGTFNIDGTMATPVQRGADPASLPVPVPGRASSGGLLGSNAPAKLNATQTAPDHWTVEGFDQQLANRQPQTQGDTAQGPLGGSMRQPFDYEAAMKSLAGDQRKPHWWQYALAILGDALAANSGWQGHGVQNLLSMQQARQGRMQDALATLAKWKHDAWQDQNQADLRAADPFTVGRSRVVYDPATGQSNVIYRGPQDFEEYAKDLGLEPGSPEYFKAVEDYVLKGSGPSAHSRDIELDDHRTGNDRSLEAFRQQGRTAMETMRQGNRRGMVDYRNANPPPARTRAPRENIATVASPQEAMKLPSGTKFRGPDGKVRIRP